MTADVELLRERLQDYADGLGAPPVLLHDVGELVALLREADAEIEALQGAYRAQLAERANEIRLREKAEARAERLAEALRGIETKLVHSMDHAKSSLDRKRAMSECADAARAALHPTAAQEDGRE